MIVRTFAAVGALYGLIIGLALHMLVNAPEALVGELAGMSCAAMIGAGLVIDRIVE